MERFSNQSLERVMNQSSDALYVQIVEHIRKWIVEGHLKEGDMLPSERELAQLFDVSRVPVREALKVLEFLGAVQHVRGKGVFIKKIAISHVLDNIEFLMMDPVHSLLDLFEAREGIEVQAVRLAAQRRTEEDIEALEAMIAEMQRNIAMGKDVGATSVKFHTAIIAATHNIVLIKVNEFLTDLLSFSRQQSLRDPRRHQIALDYHIKILEQIKEQNTEGAVTMMQGHLLSAKIEIIKRIAEKGE